MIIIQLHSYQNVKVKQLRNRNVWLQLAHFGPKPQVITITDKHTFATIELNEPMIM